MGHEPQSITGIILGYRLESQGVWRLFGKHFEVIANHGFEDKESHTDSLYNLGTQIDPYRYCGSDSDGLLLVRRHINNVVRQHSISDCLENGKPLCDTNHFAISVLVSDNSHHNRERQFLRHNHSC
eukprot:GILI01071704.1.p2 GENE.GILI01071704.1~~GILI01071704.1.p2  ORF type:complete len:126 (+),score=16.27 GILI01071704.1:316-693(+)